MVVMSTQLLLVGANRHANNRMCTTNLPVCLAVTINTPIDFLHNFHISILVLFQTL